VKEPQGHGDNGADLDSVTGPAELSFMLLPRRKLLFQASLCRNLLRQSKSLTGHAGSGTGCDWMKALEIRPSVRLLSDRYMTEATIGVSVKSRCDIPTPVTPRFPPEGPCCTSSVRKSEARVFDTF